MATPIRLSSLMCYLDYSRVWIEIEEGTDGLFEEGMGHCIGREALSGPPGLGGPRIEI